MCISEFHSYTKETELQVYQRMDPNEWPEEPEDVATNVFYVEIMLYW